MSKGVGRGRGWLNLKQNQNNTNTAVVGKLASPPATPVNQTNLMPKEESQFIDTPESGCDLVNRIKQLNVNDDGILFNQKIKYIVENWKNDCRTNEEVEKSFDKLYQACLNDNELASKLVFLVSSRSFITQEIHDHNVRFMFLRKLQNSFDTSSSVRIASRTEFRNSINLLGEFYNKARLANGSQLTFMATPLISYLEMLLEDADILDLQVFTSQFYLNGSSIKAELPDKFAEVLNDVRTLLVSGRQLAKEAKLWLLLAIEVANNRFGPLPSEITKFYEDLLGASAMASFQVSHSLLSVQTNQENKSLDNYQSNVNILQVSTAFESTINDHVSDMSNASQSASSSSGFVSNNSSSQNSSTVRKESSNSSSSKTGRPILGAGARLIKHKLNDESNKSNWRDSRGEITSADWNIKPKTGNSGWVTGDQKKTSKPNKGWEHDDRFQNDYS